MKLLLFTFLISSNAWCVDRMDLNHKWIKEEASNAIEDLKVMGMSVVCSYKAGEITVASAYLNEILRIVNKSIPISASAPSIASSDSKVCVTATIR